MKLNQNVFGRQFQPKFLTVSHWVTEVQRVPSPLPQQTENACVKFQTAPSLFLCNERQSSTVRFLHVNIVVNQVKGASALGNRLRYRARPVAMKNPAVRYGCATEQHFSSKIGENDTRRKLLEIRGKKNLEADTYLPADLHTNATWFREYEENGTMSYERETLKPVGTEWKILLWIPSRGRGTKLYTFGYLLEDICWRMKIFLVPTVNFACLPTIKIWSIESRSSRRVCSKFDTCCNCRISFLELNLIRTQRRVINFNPLRSILSFYATIMQHWQVFKYHMYCSIHCSSACFTSESRLRLNLINF